VLLAQVTDVAAHASKILSRSRPSMTTKAMSRALGEVRAATSIALNCRCDRPRVGDSGDTGGRRTCAAVPLDSGSSGMHEYTVAP
jgi:hypothetical protein